MIAKMKSARAPTDREHISYQNRLVECLSLPLMQILKSVTLFMPQHFLPRIVRSH